MEKEESIKPIDFIPVQQLQNKSFVVKDYQRGYKWQKEQIEALLKDIDQHKEGKYCLQPVVVQTQKESIEVIDGQQRLTSIYLLLYFLEQRKPYAIDYQTRDRTRDFLNNEMKILHAFNFNTVGDKVDFWQAFIKQNKTYNNVDVFHIVNVYKQIKAWFKNKEEPYILAFTKKLKTQVHIIWYNVKENTAITSAEQVFLNLNAGKVPLTNSELIKALFVLDAQKNKGKDIGKLKAFELTSEWDSIENQLQDKNFWYFICDHNYYKALDTRIDFIIDLANKISPSKSWDGKEAYRRYERLFLEGKPLDWVSIKQVFNKLIEWYSDTKNKELYHYIGYLVNTNTLQLTEIVKLSTGSTKDDFKKSLLSKITDKLNSTKKRDGNEIHSFHVNELDYEKGRVECEQVLLLLNIEQFIKDKSANKFPFDLYNEERWSVEHINPQNPKDFENFKALKSWLQSFQNYFKAKDIEAKLVLKINDFLKDTKDLDQTKTTTELRLKQEASQLLNEIIEQITSLLKLHEIGNLTLLDRNTNSSLGNKLFIDKRTEILNISHSINKREAYIPNCTKEVFTKTFTNTKEAITSEIFGFEDMKNYTCYVEQQLAKYYTND